MKINAHIDQLIIKNLMKIENVEYSLELEKDELLALLKAYPELIKLILNAVKEK